MWAKLGQLLRRILLLVAALLPRALRARLVLLPFRKDHARLVAAQRRGPSEQLDVLRQILAQNRRTEFGVAHGFAQIDTLARYREQVPARAVAQLAPYLARQRAGERDVLLAEPVEALLTDDGAARHSFPAGATALAHREWVERLVRRAARARAPETAHAEWLELLPVHAPPHNGVPLVPPAALPAYRQQASWLPRELFHLEDEALRFYLLLRLSLGRPIGVLRAGAPGTLAILAQHLEQQAERLIDDLARGAISLRDKLDDALAARLPPPTPDPRLAEHLRAINKATRLRPRDIWPQLRLLVCPSSGIARAAAERLPDRFGALPVLDPGRNTAAAPLTLPGDGQEDAELISEGLFWEFLPEGAERPLTAEALQSGQRCAPVLTAPNGLYRAVLDLSVEVVSRRDAALRVTLGGPPALGLQLDEGPLADAQLAAAVAAAAQRCDLLVAGYTAWMSEEERGGPTRDQQRPPRQSWLRRLLPAAAAKAAAVAARPGLIIAVEPAAELPRPGAEGLVAALERALQAACPAYAEGRKERLASMRAVVLQRGAFARLAHTRLARGYLEGHAAAPALVSDPPPFAEEEVAQEVSGS